MKIKKSVKTSGVSPFIASVLTILFGVLMLGIVLGVVNPTLKRAQDSTVITDSFQNLNLLNSAIKEVASEAQGSKRTVSISVSGGEYSIDGTTDSLLFIYDPSQNMYLTGTKGDIKIEHGSVFLDFFNWYVDDTTATPVWTNTSGQWIVDNYKYKGDGGLAYHNLSTLENYKFSGDINNVSGSTGGQIFMTPTNPERLVGFWAFDNASGTKAYDWSGNGINGTLKNMADPATGISGWNSTDCKYGSCLKLDGENDFVNCGNDSSLNPTNEITVSAWIYQNSHSVTNYKYMVGKGTQYNQEPFMLVATQDPVWMFKSWDGVNDRGVETTPYLNEWHHLVGVFGGTFIRIYDNGELKNEVTFASQSIAVETHNVTIGGSDGVGRYFNGTIDEVKIWNVSLTADEVAAEYELSAKKIRTSGSQSVNAKTPNAAIVLANPDGVTNFDDIKVSKTVKEQKLVIPYSKIELNGTLRITKGEHRVTITHRGTNTTLNKPIIEIVSS
jgi:type II secretory pathway pseudopilin PulG